MAVDCGELLRQATSHKESGDWDAAVKCLYQFKRMAETDSTVYPIETHLRLPLYLQAAGRFNDAIAEFNLLLNNAKAQKAKEYAHQPVRVQTMLWHSDLSIVYDKMRLAYQREGLPDEVARYRKLSDEHKEKYKAALAIDEEIRRKELEIRQQERDGYASHDESSAPAATIVKYPDPPPAKKNATVKVSYSAKEKLEIVVGFALMGLIVWTVVHFFF